MASPEGLSPEHNNIRPVVANVSLCSLTDGYHFVLRLLPSNHRYGRGRLVDMLTCENPEGIGFRETATQLIESYDIPLLTPPQHYGTNRTLATYQGGEVRDTRRVFFLANTTTDALWQLVEKDPKVVIAPAINLGIIPVRHYRRHVIKLALLEHMGRVLNERLNKTPDASPPFNTSEYENEQLAAYAEQNPWIYTE